MIGREASANVNLVLAIPTVSSTHAMIDFVDGEFFLTDLSSTNGTFVNGKGNQSEDACESCAMPASAAANAE